MSQRDSGYERKERDLYETPEWVTMALLPHLPWRANLVAEPAAGGGKMARALVAAATDIEQGYDFLKEGEPRESIITNPPYSLAKEFIDHAIDLTEERRGHVAMLLRTDFDHASSRRGLFKYCKIFSKKVVLIQRIRWFEGSTGSPSFNHAWFIWDWRHEGAPTLAYGP